jgi:hypothetical protein
MEEEEGNEEEQEDQMAGMDADPFADMDALDPSAMAGLGSDQIAGLNANALGGFGESQESGPDDGSMSDVSMVPGGDGFSAFGALDAAFEPIQGEGLREDEDITNVVDAAIQGVAPATGSSLADDLREEPPGFDPSEIAPSDDDSSLGG